MRVDIKDSNGSGGILNQTKSQKEAFANLEAFLTLTFSVKRNDVED